MPERANHVWAYDFVEDRTHNGRKFRILTIIDEFTRECLAIKVARRGSPWENGYIESFNGKLRDELLRGERLRVLWISDSVNEDDDFGA